MSAAPAAPATQQQQQQLPQPPQPPQPPATTFLSRAHAPRVRSISAEGVEEHAEDNPWVHMQLTDPFQQASKTDGGDTSNIASGEAAAAGADRQDAPRPEEVINAFAAAKGELEWLLALLNTLREGRYLTVGRVEKVSGQQRLVDMAVGANSRFRRRSAAAAAAAAALSEGAAALAALGRKEDAFYEQVAQLQRYWKVQTEPPDSPYAYTVDLQLSHSSSDGSDGGSSGGGGSGSSGTTAAAAAAAVGRGPVAAVRILKDPCGMLRVQVPAAKPQQPPTVTFKGVEEPPAVVTGPGPIHGLLLQQLRINACHLALQTLDGEMSQLLGLPARLQPSAAAAAAAGGAAAGSSSSSSSKPASSSQHHLRFYAMLSNLVLQAVIGSAATAGEDAVLLLPLARASSSRRAGGAAAARRMLLLPTPPTAAAAAAAAARG